MTVAHTSMSPTAFGVLAIVLGCCALIWPEWLARRRSLPELVHPRAAVPRVRVIAQRVIGGVLVVGGVIALVVG